VSRTAGDRLFIGRSLYPMISPHGAEPYMKSALIHVNVPATRVREARISARG